MKILYVKNNSERAKEFQLKTIIYEENGEKFVKKEALCEEAIPHLKKMKGSYEKLTASIVNPNIKLAKIIDEGADSLTFEFIDGVSLEKRFNDALKLGDNASNDIIDEYMKLLKTGFKTTVFDCSAMVDDVYQQTFGNLDYSKLNDELCFDNIANIDLIFSNIIFKDTDIYLIDYEWVYELNIPIDYIAFRSLQNPNNLLKQMEKTFIDEVVVNKNGFYKIQTNYSNPRFNIVHQIQEKDQQIQEKDQQIQEKEQQIQHLHDVIQFMRLTNRFKRIIKKIIPKKILETLQQIKNSVSVDTIRGKLEKPNSFNGSILNTKHNFGKINNNLCIFSHFDKDGMIDDYVMHYLKSLFNADIDIIFVSTAKNISNENLNKLSPYCRDIIIKENIGYDFGAWKTGLKYIDNEIENYNGLLLCNDSVYAPLYDLNSMMDEMNKKSIDFWGITDSYDVNWHLQSYFLFFNNNVFLNKVFKDFWRDYKVYKIKRNIIEKYEVGLTNVLSKGGFKFSSYCPSNKLINDKKVNTTHFFWKELIIDKKCPIIKIELLRDNPMQMDIKHFEKVINQVSNYDTQLIKTHLARFKVD